MVRSSSTPHVMVGVLMVLAVLVAVSMMDVVVIVVSIVIRMLILVMSHTRIVVKLVTIEDPMNGWQAMHDAIITLWRHPRYHPATSTVCTWMSDMELEKKKEDQHEDESDRVETSYRRMLRISCTSCNNSSPGPAFHSDRGALENDSEASCTLLPLALRALGVLLHPFWPVRTSLEIPASHSWLFG